MGHSIDHFILNLLKYATKELELKLTSGHLLGRC